ncbi:PspA/IM30 family protein [Iodidimonas sp. SYSU 1G8]|uniref:PspA/IM30 family protein n=1 Tax=Iodidimonas sp. SYSU 1G8 TaxID=3133967 RepID=UPI0031FE69D8
MDTIASRVGRIISGSVNALLDAVEGAAPETVMDQAIREIDVAIDDVRQELGRASAAKHLANKRLAEKNAAHEDLAGKIEIALDSGREDLAQVAVESQLDIEAQMPVLEQTIMECQEREKELEGFIAALQAKRREMREELKRFADSRRIAAGETGADGAPHTGNKVNRAIDKASSAFDRVLEKNGGVPGLGTASTANAAQLQELEKLARENRVKERLASIKSNRQS